MGMSLGVYELNHKCCIDIMVKDLHWLDKRSCHGNCISNVNINSYIEFKYPIAYLNLPAKIMYYYIQYNIIQWVL